MGTVLNSVVRIKGEREGEKKIYFFFVEKPVAVFHVILLGISMFNSYDE